MVYGALISAAVQAGSAVGNWLTSKAANDKINARLEQQLREGKSDLVTDNYGNWKLAGADRYFNQASEKWKQAMQQARASRRMGKQDPDIAEGVSKGLADAATGANAQYEAARMQRIGADKSNIQNIQQMQTGIDRQHSQDITKSWEQLGKAGTSLGRSIDGVPSANAPANSSDSGGLQFTDDETYANGKNVIYDPDGKIEAAYKASNGGV